ncbi:MAG TPA: hypothetical protein VMB81_32655, partial [Candidatus Sulfotelmatobacter sp.]|nr:hypothetical protein [Candidatus Sulfotelmatobacter sp.]
MRNHYPKLSNNCRALATIPNVNEHGNRWRIGDQRFIRKSGPLNRNESAFTLNESQNADCGRHEQKSSKYHEKEREPHDWLWMTESLFTKPHERFLVLCLATPLSLAPTILLSNPHESALRSFVGITDDLWRF